MIKYALLIGPRREEKTQNPVGFESTTSRVLLCRHVLYHCATLQPLPLLLTLNEQHVQFLIDPKAEGP